MKNYKFENLEKGLISFIANLEAKLQYYVPEIPVYMINTGDNSYWFKRKFETSVDKFQEIYQKVPRAILNSEDIEFMYDENTMQYSNYVYIHEEVEYTVKARRQSIIMPIPLEFVCSNYIKALGYVEMIASLLSIDNAFTYESMGNTFQGAFSSKNITLKKPDNDAVSRNYIIGGTINVNFQVMLIRTNSINLLNPTDENGNPITRKIMIELNANSPLYKDAINPLEPNSARYTKNQFKDDE